MNTAVRIANLISVSLSDEPTTLDEYKNLIVGLVYPYKKDIAALRRVHDVAPLLSYFPVLREAEAVFFLVFADNSYLFVYSTPTGNDKFKFTTFSFSLDDYGTHELHGLVRSIALAGWDQKVADEVTATFRRAFEKARSRRT